MDWKFYSAVNPFCGKFGKWPKSITINIFEVESTLILLQENNPFFTTQSAHSPKFRRKSSITGNTGSFKKSWTQLQSFRFPFRYPCRKGRNATFPISIFKIKSALNPAKNRISVFHSPFSTFPLHSAEKAPLRGKSFTIKVLDTIPNFSFPFR